MLVGMTPEYRDRFAAATYADDVLIRVFRADQYGPIEDNELWMPERLWNRIRCIGQGYELHLTPLFDGSTDPVFLNGSQAAQLEQELVFIEGVVNDPVASSWIELLVTLLRMESQGASKDAVGIEFP
jgi:hypothetical protein